MRISGELGATATQQFLERLSQLLLADESLAVTASIEGDINSPEIRLILTDQSAAVFDVLRSMEKQKKAAR